MVCPNDIPPTILNHMYHTISNASMPEPCNSWPFTPAIEIDGLLAQKVAATKIAKLEEIGGHCLKHNGEAMIGNTYKFLQAIQKEGLP